MGSNFSGFSWVVPYDCNFDELYHHFFEVFVDFITQKVFMLDLESCA